MKKNKALLRRALSILLSLMLLAAPALALDTAQAGELLQKYYIDSVSQEVLSQSTVEDMISALGDPYTQYFDAREYAEFLAAMSDTHTGGVGVTSTMTDRGMVVESLTEGMPAQKAGIQPGDIITAVDGVTVIGQNAQAAAARLRGEPGTKVTVTVLRNGESRDYVLTREELVIPTTTTTLLDDHIGYITCTTFGDETEGHFVEGIQANDAAADRWIVDLRGNGGGSVSAAAQTAGMFAGSGNLVYLRDKSGSYAVEPREEGELTIDPVITLVDGGTASASEIFASVIRDQNAGIVIGSRTYGKGVAQILLDETNYPGSFTEGDALKVTAYRYFSPNGTTADRVGVIPDLLVDDAYAADVAYLLSSSAHAGDTYGQLRVDMKWRWYVDLETATSETGKPAFTALLEALPPQTPLWLGTGGADGWMVVTVDTLVQKYGLDSYTPRTFTDISDATYAAAINKLAAYQIVSGSGDGTFRPEANLTRAEFCALLAQALHDSRQGDTGFADVPADAWYAPSLNALTAMGLISGYSDGLFHPDDPMDHQQFLTIMGRLADYLSMNFHEAAKTEHSAALGDYWAWAGWSRESLWLLDGSQKNIFGQTLSLLWAPLGEIEPTALTTREEAAAMVYNLFAVIGLLTV